MSQEIQKFRLALNPFLHDWGSIDLRVIAQRFKDNRWLFNAVHAVLEPIPPSAPTCKDLPTATDLLVAHERWDIGQVNDLLDSILKGELKIAGDIVHIKRFDGQNLQPGSVYFSFYDRNTAKSDFGIDSASFVLKGWESDSASYEKQDIIENQLRSRQPPWDGLSDLRQYFIGYPRQTALRTDSRNLNIIAPLNVRLAKASLEEQRVRASIERTSETINEGIALSVIAHLSDEFIQEVLYLKSCLYSGFNDRSKKGHALLCSVFASRRRT